LLVRYALLAREGDPLQNSSLRSDAQQHVVQTNLRRDQVLFFMPPHKAMITMKSGTGKPVDAIKNSADEDPEGYSTVLDAPMCNGGLVLPITPFLSGILSTSCRTVSKCCECIGVVGRTHVSMKKEKDLGREEALLYTKSGELA